MTPTCTGKASQAVTAVLVGNGCNGSLADSATLVANMATRARKDDFVQALSVASQRAQLHEQKAQRTLERSRPRSNSGGWVSSVSTQWPRLPVSTVQDDLVNGNEGQYRVRFMDNLKDADCAYPALELLLDGTIVTTTYGHWTEGEAPQAHTESRAGARSLASQPSQAPQT